MQINLSLAGSIKKSEIILQENILDNFYLTKDIFLRNKKVFFIVDSFIYQKYAPKVIDALKEMGLEIHIEVIEVSKGLKNLDNVANIINKVGLFNLSKSGAIIGFGGGNIIEIAKAVSSLYVGGVELVLIPTTLVSQIDKSIGGYYSLNHGDFKDVVTGEKLAKYVIIDPALMRTLPQENLLEGIVSIIKYAIVMDKPLFEKLEKCSAQDIKSNLNTIILKCINNKIKLIKSGIEYGKGSYHIMRFSRSVATMLHHYPKNQYKRYQRVALGMYFAALKSDTLSNNEHNIAIRLKAMLNKFGINCEFPDISKDELIELLKMYQKMLSDYIVMVYLDDIGSASTLRVLKDNFPDFWIDTLDKCNK